MIRSVVADVARLAASGARVGRAVLVSRRGSAPFLPGATLLVAEDGRLAGAISGGCAEAEAVAAMDGVFRSGVAAMAWLSQVESDPVMPASPCAGRLEVLLEPALHPQVLAAAADFGGAVHAVAVEGPAPVGDGMLVRPDGSWTRVAHAPNGSVSIADAAGDVVREALSALRDGESRCVDIALPVARLTPSAPNAPNAPNAPDASSAPSAMSAPAAPCRVFLEVIPAVPRLVVVGAVGIAVPLLRAGRALGWRTVVVDPRAAFLDAVRGAEPDVTLRAWPDVAIPSLALTAADAVCALSHDVKIDDPALAAALRTPAGYVGAIGSRKTQTLRRERMRAAGFTDADFSRLRGPVGLDLGSRSPEAVALSILAEIEGLRGGGTGRPLTELRGG